jgi:hypothetical protein
MYEKSARRKEATCQLLQIRREKQAGRTPSLPPRVSPAATSAYLEGTKSRLRDKVPKGEACALTKDRPSRTISAGAHDRSILMRALCSDDTAFLEIEKFVYPSLLWSAYGT